ncbi:MAG TPA: DUF1028 domain-containing protein [Gaiellales bacterium]|jgi:uncharacterized Ntn-hydrolase superfamily protein
MTFSLAGRDAETGMFGTVVASSSPCVAARCAHARAGAGAVASQNVTDPSLGPRLLSLLAAGEAAADAIAAVVADAPFAEYRQLTAVDREGRTAIWSGERTLGTNAEAQGVDCIAAGNLLASTRVPSAMVQAYESSAGAQLVERLVRALEAGLAAGGEAGPVRSAGLVAVDRVSWPVADLRVDWHDDPVSQLRTLWSVWEPQMHDYVTRALDPTSAPSYGVPGDT